MLAAGGEKLYRYILVKKGKKVNNYSVIFDLDGVLIDSNPYHRKSWKTFCEKQSISITDEILEKKIFGRTGNEAVSILFNNNISQDLIQVYTEEVDCIYRESFAPYIKPIKGSVEFLESLKKKEIVTAIATSAPPKNVEFVMGKTNLRKYFNTIVDNTFITQSKPNPEIYLKTAQIIKQDPKRCIVIEDSLSGIESAIGAGMKVIGITTTHSERELSGTDYIINNFDELNLSILDNLINS